MRFGRFCNPTTPSLSVYFPRHLLLAIFSSAFSPHDYGFLPKTRPYNPPLWEGAGDVEKASSGCMLTRTVCFKCYHYDKNDGGNVLRTEIRYPVSKIEDGEYLLHLLSLERFQSVLLVVICYIDGHRSWLDGGYVLHLIFFEDISRGRLRTRGLQPVQVYSPPLIFKNAGCSPVFIDSVVFLLPGWLYSSTLLRCL